MSNEFREIISELHDALDVVKNLSSEQLGELYELSNIYCIKCGNNGLSPSDFDDYLSNEINFSNYTIATLVLDGECGNYLQTLHQDVCETGEEERQIEDIVHQIFSLV